MHFRSFLLLTCLFLFLFFFKTTPLLGKPKPAQVDLYVMGLCPFSAQLENTLALILQEKKTPIRINFYYIANETANGDINSFRGEIEVEEDMRQLVIQKYYPNQFWKYLQSRNTDYRTAWKTHAFWAGLSPDRIEKKVKEEGKALLREAIKKPNQLGIKNSPTLYINGQLYQGNRSLPVLTLALSKNEKGEKVSTSLPDCFSDSDCVGSLATTSSRCVDGGTPKAKCEPLTIPLTAIILKNDFPLDSKPMDILTREVPNLKPVVQKIVWDSPEGKEWLEKIPASTLPLYVWGENFSLLDAVPALETYRMVQSLNAPDGKKIYWFSPAFVQPNFYLNRPRQPNQLDLFVMSQCPFGVWAENQILPVARQNGIAVNIHYIITEQTSNPSDPQAITLSSLHGPAELEEDFRQVCIQKYFPDRFPDYLLERAKNFQSSLWDQTASKILGPESIQKIQECAAGEGKTILLQNSQMTKEMNIHSSPTVLWENQYRFNDLKELKQSIPAFSGIEIKEGGCGQ